MSKSWRQDLRNKLYERDGRKCHMALSPVFLQFLYQFPIESIHQLNLPVIAGPLLYKVVSQSYHLVKRFERYPIDLANWHNHIPFLYVSQH